MHHSLGICSRSHRPLLLLRRASPAGKLEAAVRLDADFSALALMVLVGHTISNWDD